MHFDGVEPDVWADYVPTHVAVHDEVFPPDQGRLTQLPIRIPALLQVPPVSNSSNGFGLPGGSPRTDEQPESEPQGVIPS